MLFKIKTSVFSLNEIIRGIGKLQVKLMTRLWRNAFVSEVNGYQGKHLCHMKSSTSHTQQHGCICFL